MGSPLRELKLERTSAMVNELRLRGASLDEIAVECGASWWTVLRWMRRERAPHPGHLALLTRMYEDRKLANGNT